MKIAQERKSIELFKFFATILKKTAGLLVWTL